MSSPFSIFFRRLPLQEQINFARHLSITIKAGLPLFEGLKIIRRQTVSRRMGRVLDRLIVEVNNGQSLANSLERHGGVFGDFFINIIRIGETSGSLAENLLYLSEELKKSKFLRSRIKSALIYPTIILIATIGIAALLIFFIFPKVLPIFGSLRIKLPLTTRILIIVSDFLLTRWRWILGGAVAALLLIRLSFFLRGTRAFLNRLVLYLPIVGRLTVDVNIANLSRIMGVLLKSGIKIVEAVTITSKTLSNLVYRRALENAAFRIQRGEQLAESLLKEKRLFPKLFANMVEIGENTGNLQDNLFYLSDYYTDEVDLRVHNLTTLLEPLLLIIMGSIVGFIALSIITPIYEVSSSLEIR